MFHKHVFEYESVGNCIYENSKQTDGSFKAANHEEACEKWQRANLQKGTYPLTQEPM